MDYENRLPEEGLNTTQVHPLKQFVQLAIGALVLIVALVFLLQVSGSTLAKRVPFDFEVAVMERLDIEFGKNSEHPEMVEYLNELAQRLLVHMPVPEDMQVEIHYSPEPVFNAFATVGGNLMFYRGLLSRIDNENMLAMVMAHEIAHVLHRDPVASLGGGLASTIALLALTGNAGTGTAGTVLQNAGALTSMRFTRQMETAADEQAVKAVQALYGHVNGTARLFELFSKVRGGSVKEPSDRFERFLSTHPLDADRILRITQQAQQSGWSIDGELTPLPQGFKSWL